MDTSCESEDMGSRLRRRDGQILLLSAQLQRKQQSLQSQVVIAQRMGEELTRKDLVIDGLREELLRVQSSHRVADGRVCLLQYQLERSKQELIAHQQQQLPLRDAAISTQELLRDVSSVNVDINLEPPAPNVLRESLTAAFDLNDWMRHRIRNEFILSDIRQFHQLAQATDALSAESARENSMDRSLWHTPNKNGLSTDSSQTKGSTQRPKTVEALPFVSPIVERDEIVDSSMLSPTALKNLFLAFATDPSALSREENRIEEVSSTYRSKSSSSSLKSPESSFLSIRSSPGPGAKLHTSQHSAVFPNKESSLTPNRSRNSSNHQSHNSSANHSLSSIHSTPQKSVAAAKQLVQVPMSSGDKSSRRDSVGNDETTLLASKLMEGVSLYSAMNSDMDLSSYSLNVTDDWLARRPSSQPLFANSAVKAHEAKLKHSVFPDEFLTGESKIERALFQGPITANTAAASKGLPVTQAVQKPSPYVGTAQERPVVLSMHKNAPVHDSKRIHTQKQSPMIFAHSHNKFLINETITPLASNARAFGDQLARIREENNKLRSDISKFRGKLEHMKHEATTIRNNSSTLDSYSEAFHTRRQIV